MRAPSNSIERTLYDLGVQVEWKNTGSRVEQDEELIQATQVASEEDEKKEFKKMKI